MVIVKRLRSDTDQSINVDKEVFAQAIANTLAPFFSSFAGSGSFNRTALNLSLGAATPLAGILSAFVVFILIEMFGALLTYNADAGHRRYPDAGGNQHDQTGRDQPSVFLDRGTIGICDNLVRDSLPWPANRSDHCIYFIGNPVRTYPPQNSI